MMHKVHTGTVRNRRAAEPLNRWVAENRRQRRKSIMTWLAIVAAGVGYAYLWARYVEGRSFTPPW